MASRRATLSVLVLLCVSGPLLAQDRYRTPPQVVVDVLDAPPLPAVTFSQDRAWMLLAARASRPRRASASAVRLRRRASMSMLC